MFVQHIAGLPVEEILLAALAAAAPVITLAVLEIRSRIKRLKRFLRRPATRPTHQPGRTPCRRFRPSVTNPPRGWLGVGDVRG
ncbi:hypothetical protein [Kribbella sp. HUAS MG21]|uniref:Uncharacterized protein n=1 Tax=Kribbella sp. HUAS MG21 TaxID=3160966 RepID=A0AAU7TI82_9ACTN